MWGNAVLISLNCIIPSLSSQWLPGAFFLAISIFVSVSCYQFQTSEKVREGIRWGIDKAVVGKRDKAPGFEHPRQCPCGHTHLSWGQGEERVYCWDCNRYQSISVCLSSGDVSSPGKASEKQLTVLEEQKPDEQHLRV